MRTPLRIALLASSALAGFGLLLQPVHPARAAPSAADACSAVLANRSPAAIARFRKEFPREAEACLATATTSPGVGTAHGHGSGGGGSGGGGSGGGSGGGGSGGGGSGGGASGGSGSGR